MSRLAILIALQWLTLAPFCFGDPSSAHNASVSITSHSSPLNASSYGSEPRLGWTSSPNYRGTIEIIWSSVFTMFLCSWSVLCLNVISKTDTPFRVFHRRLWLTALCVLGPEFTLQIALGQYYSAKCSVKDFRAAGLKGWTLSHAFYADMGGFVLHTADGFPPFPVDAKQLLFLIQERFIESPKLEKRAIKDKNKVDGMLRILTLCQTIWFAVNLVGRAAAHLAITCIELTTAAFIVCSIGTTFCWLHKPADVSIPNLLSTEHTIQEIVFRAYAKVDAERAQSRGRHAGDNVGQDHLYVRSPLDILSRKEWPWSKYWSNWINIIRHLGINFAPPTRPVDRFENSTSIALPGPLYALWLGVTGIIFGMFFFAWDFEFPTPIERRLWRIATVALLSTLPAFTMVTNFAFRTYPALKRRGRRLMGLEASPPTGHRWFGQTRAGIRVKRIAKSIRNNSLGKDPALDVPLKAILPMYILGVVYCHARTYILLADVIELRSLPASAYAQVDWSTLVPHLT
jgi:hypothetical protein